MQEVKSFGPHDRYRVVSTIGRGGFAIVYRAYHAALDRYVAIKVLRPEMVEPEGAHERFQTEAKASARLAGHPNIITVYDYGEQDGAAYLVLQYVEGQTLEQRLASPITALEIDRIVTGVGSALDFAHRHKLIHCDVKPSNVLVAKDGTPLLSDFGIAKLLDVMTAKTNTLLGTPAYMSPEQITGAPLDGRTDVYSLGVMLHRIFVGKPPFQGLPMSILHQHVHSPVPPLPPHPVTGRPVPVGVEQVIQTALAKRPEDRQATAGQLAAELRQALAPLILAEQARAALRARDLTRADEAVTELIRRYPGLPEGAPLQREVERLREWIAQRALPSESLHGPGRVEEFPKPPSVPVAVQSGAGGLSIFLCHASDDKALVRDLYRRLHDDLFDPWLDEEKILPGQDWEREIRRAVNGADIVIVCLSHRSASKAGFVQKEIKLALDVADEQPEDTIFLIPLRLEDCDVPERLRRWHWVNWFERNGYERLRRALQRRAESNAASASH